MEPTITVYCKNTHTYHDVPRGISLIELKDRLGIQLKFPIIAALVNYKVEKLGLFRSLYYLAHWAWNGYKKYRK